MPYTTQQAAAIETRNVSIALAAGAGCGKTFVLTQRYVAELLRNPSTEMLDRLMAITFTDRAAREMRDRIRARILEELQQCDETDVPAWQEILRDLESARIQTIHAFCTSTLRRYSTELGIDPEFSVLDAPTASSLLAETIEAQLEKFLRDRNPDASNLVLRFGLEGTLRILQSLVEQRFQLREAVAVANDAEELAEVWQCYHHSEFLPRKMQELAESRELHELYSLLLTEEPTAPKMQERRAILLEHMGTLRRTQTLNTQDLQELRDASMIQGATKKHWSSEEVYESAKEGLKRFRDLLDKILPLLTLDVEPIALSAELGMQALRLTSNVVTAYQQNKLEQSALDFDDLLLTMRDLIQDNASVRKSLQKSTHFLLLDEFQDTDPVQTEIVRAICGNQLTSGGLFLVGDVKQSIYRFRRSDPAVFRALRGEIPGQGQMSLTKNFRSQQGVLDFVNYLFEPAMPEEYDALTAFDETTYPPKEKIEFLWADDPEREIKNVKDKRELEAEWIASRIQQLLDDPTPRIREKNTEGDICLRPMRPGDVTILFRAFSNLSVYEDALRRLGIEYYVVGGRAFFAQQEIFDLVNLCRFLDDISDEVALVGILRSPMFGWSDETLFHFAHGSLGLWNRLQDHSLSEWIESDQKSCVDRARMILLELISLKNRIGIGPLLRHAVSATAYDAALMTEFLPERKVANLHKLLKMADQFDQIGLLGLSEFSDRLLESITEEAKEEMAATHAETGNVVRLMTVHQSKGLEFPVVFVADVNRQRSGGSSSAILHTSLGPLLSLPLIKGEKPENPAMMMYRDSERIEDEAEAIRLFYVATTRAADYLVLSAYWHPDESITGPWMSLLSERFDLSTGLPKGDPLTGQVQQPGIDINRIPQIHIVQKKPVRTQEKSQPRKLKLSDWSQKLSTAEPIAPPAIALPLPISKGIQDRYSVSEVEAMDSQIRQSQAQISRFTTSNDKDQLNLHDSEMLGHLLHAALENVKFDQTESAEKLIDTAAEQFAETFSESIRKTAIERMSFTLKADFIQELRSARKLYREAEFLIKWTLHESSQVTSISGTIDCLLQDEAGLWHIIDYKTGAVPAQQEDVLEKFGIQMTLYALAIKSMTGQLPSSIRILQLADTIRTFAIDLNQEIVSQFRNRVDQAILERRDH